MECENFFSTSFLLKDLKSMKNAYLWYEAVEGAKMAVVLGLSGSGRRLGGTWQHWSTSSGRPPYPPAMSGGGPGGRG
jgi:hypothetical protein